MAPEGTKFKTNKLKTGFYYIAKQANVPILLANLDYERKVIEIGELFYPTDNMEKDFNLY